MSKKMSKKTEALAKALKPKHPTATIARVIDALGLEPTATPAEVEEAFACLMAIAAPKLVEKRAELLAAAISTLIDRVDPATSTALRARLRGDK